MSLTLINNNIIEKQKFGKSYSNEGIFTTILHYPVFFIIKYFNFLLKAIIEN